MSSSLSAPSDRGGSPRSNRRLSPTNRTRVRRQVSVDPEIPRDTSRPLLDVDANSPVPSLASPEMDLDDDRREMVEEHDANPQDNIETLEPPKTNVNGTPGIVDVDERNAGRPNSRRNSNPFPYPPGFGPGVFIETEIGLDGREIPDVNFYQQKKILAQGMMDLALFSANANQLRYVLESFDRHPYYYGSLILISISLCFQVAVGVLLIWNARYNVKDKVEICKANRINNFTIIGVFLITVINVFISAFGVANVAPNT